MLRIWNFYKTDWIKIPPSWVHVVLPVVAFVVAYNSDMEERGGIMMGFTMVYCLFVGIILGTAPFDSETEDEIGFIQMLPAKPGEQIAGHFLYGLITIAVSAVTGLVLTGVLRLLRPEIGAASGNGFPMTQMYLVLAALALLVIGMEELLLTAFRFQNRRIKNWCRSVPAFVYFFGIGFVSDGQRESIVRLLKRIFANPFGGTGILTAGIAVYLLLTVIAVRIQVAKE